MTPVLPQAWCPQRGVVTVLGVSPRVLVTAVTVVSPQVAVLGQAPPCCQWLLSLGGLGTQVTQVTVLSPVPGGCFGTGSSLMPRVSSASPARPSPWSSSGSRPCPTSR